MSRIFWSLALLLGSFWTLSGAAAEPDLAKLLSSSKRIVFLGDSITYSGQYVDDFTAWLETQPWEQIPEVINVGLPSETVSGLSEEGHANGQFPRPDVAERLTRVLDVTKPDLVFVCYGMNCGIYQAFDEERFLKYQQGITAVRQAILARDAQVIHLTPPIYEDRVKPFDYSYNEVLDKYSKWLIGERANGWQVIDLHFPMQAALEKARTENSSFKICPDAIHPNATGHWWMARELIRQFGDEAAADADSPEAMLAAKKVPVEVLKLVQERGHVLRDANLLASGHKRPGIKTGLPLHTANEQAAKLTRQIRKLVKMP